LRGTGEGYLKTKRLWRIFSQKAGSRLQYRDLSLIVCGPSNSKRLPGKIIFSDRKVL
jgi:hypothetical protein